MQQPYPSKLSSTVALQPDDLLSVAALIGKAKNLIYLRLACEFLLFKHWIKSVCIYTQPYLTPLVPAGVDDAHTMPLVLALKGVPELVVLFITGCFPCVDIRHVWQLAHVSQGHPMPVRSAFALADAIKRDFCVLVSFTLPGMKVHRGQNHH